MSRDNFDMLNHLERLWRKNRGEAEGKNLRKNGCRDNIIVLFKNNKFTFVGFHKACGRAITAGANAATFA